jgi:hypothetical protein
MKNYEASFLYLFLLTIALIINNSVLYDYTVAKMVLGIIYLLFIIKCILVYLELEKSEKEGGKGNDK